LGNSPAVKDHEHGLLVQWNGFKQIKVRIRNFACDKMNLRLRKRWSGFYSNAQMFISNGIGKSVVKNEVTVVLKRKFVGLQ